MADKKSKDWFDKDLAIMLSEKIKILYEPFDSRGFIQEIDIGTRDLELKARLSLFAEQLRAKLPADYPQAIQILVQILGPENENETGMFTEFYWAMPLATFVEEYGLDHFSESINAIAEITKRNTSEYCIRPFLKTYPDKTWTVMEKWSHNPNFHLRRLATEGMRPRLPWAKKLDQYIEDPQPVLDILEHLKDDDSKYVQKSVANNLNDILKDNYDAGIKTIKRWAKDPSKNRKWIIKHALRKQIKDGNIEAQQIKAALD